MARIAVCGVSELPATLQAGYTHIVSIRGSVGVRQREIEEVLENGCPGALIHVCEFDDVEAAQEHAKEPSIEDIREILAFASLLEENSAILVHCAAGISRSAAVACAILCQSRRPGDEGECLAYLGRIRPQAVPNRLIVKLADGILGREGAMVRANEIYRSRRYMGGYSDDDL